VAFAKTHYETQWRCSPVFGFDWAYDDANGQGFNGSTSVYTGNDRGDRKIITITASELVY